MARRRTIAGLTAVLAVCLTLVAWRSVPTALGSVLDRCGGTHWVGAWRAAPQSSSLGKADLGVLGLVDGRERAFDDQTVRVVVVPHVAGEALRVRLGNRFGPAEVTIDAVTVAVRSTGASILPGSMQPVIFDGSRTVRVAAGTEAVSDPLPGRIEPFVELLVSFHVAGVAVVDFHQWATGTHYASAPGSGDHTAAAGDAAFVEELSSVYGITGVDVLAPRSVGAVVTLGDSITDGVGSSPDLQRRWPDQLARRLLDSGELSVVNAGIGGNHVTTDGTIDPRAVGPSAVMRFGNDVAAVPGVTDVIVFEGINDIGSADTTVGVRDRIIDGYRQIIREAHAADLRVIGATITPAGLGGAKESIRRSVNQWIRTSGEFDAVVDFDRAVRDPREWSRVRPEHDAYMAHLTDAGYRTLADAVDPSVFAGTGC